MSSELERQRREIADNIVSAFCERGRFKKFGPISTEFSELLNANLAEFERLVREDERRQTIQILASATNKFCPEAAKLIMDKWQTLVDGPALQEFLAVLRQR